MTSPIEDDGICRVEAGEPHLIESNLNAAVDVALERAVKDGRFCSPVTRHGHTTFTAGLSTKVPLPVYFYPVVRCIRMHHGSSLRADTDSWSSHAPYVRHT